VLQSTAAQSAHRNTRSPSFESFQPVVIFPLVHSVASILTFYSSVSFTSFTPSDHKKGSQIVIVIRHVLSMEQPCLTCHNIITTQRTMKISWVQVGQSLSYFTLTVSQSVSQCVTQPASQPTSQPVSQSVSPSVLGVEPLAGPMTWC
jgi:hypothetical protein